MAEGRSAFLSLSLSPSSKRAVNRIIRLMAVRAKANEREREREREREGSPRYSKAIESMLSNTIHG